MRSPSIEWFHAKIERQIRLVESYTDIKNLGFIIKACRLKPYDYVFKNNDDKVILYRWWFDEFGNSFELKKKNIKLVFNDLRLNRQKITCTDLYYGLSIKQIAKMSKLVYIVAGKDEDLNQDYYFLTFLGIDNHFRSYLYLYDKWQRVSPLLMGMPSLKILAKNLDIKFFQQIKNKDNLTVPCVGGKSWISFLPLSKDFSNVLKKECENLFETFK